MMRHEFLVLALLFAAPAVPIALLRPDLRPVMVRMALAAQPFALTEWLFYPNYWSPRFLFDLVAVLGFGIEDLLFVAGLGAYASTAYAFVAGRRYVGPGQPRPFARAALPIGASLVLALTLLGLGMAMIFAALAAMVAVAAAMLVRRPDLLMPGLAGGLLTVVVYAVLCLVFAALDPGVFGRIWHTERLWNRFVLGVPLEELAYGFAAGLAATVLYPYAFGLRFAKRRNREPCGPPSFGEAARTPRLRRRPSRWRPT